MTRYGLISLCTLVALAQAPAPKPGAAVTLTAVLEHGPNSRDTVKIDILNWSTDAERDRLYRAWTQPNAPAGRGGQGKQDNSDPFGSFGRNRAVPDDDPALDGVNPAQAKGKGKGKGGPPAEAPKLTPEIALRNAMGSMPIVGHLWSSAEVAGYNLRYAARIGAPDGSERVLLLTDRRLGAFNDAWKTAGTPLEYEYSLVELRIPAKGAGEGKASLTAKIAADEAAKTLALDNYAGSPVLLKEVKKK